MEPGPSPRRWRWLGRLVLVAGLAYAVWFAVTWSRVARQEDRDETRPADAIVVFGAAEYFGKPSPVFRARLDHAYLLYQRRLAPFVIVTGGSGDARYTEGGVGRDYLVGRGLPEDRVIAETQSEDTGRSAERVAAIMQANRMKSCVAVSDGYHMFRIKRMLAAQGVEVYGAPRPGSRTSGWARAAVTAREALSYTLWKLGIT